MATQEQIVAYIRQYKDRYPLAALKAQLLKQGIPEAAIDQAIQLASAPPAPAAQPAPQPVQPAPAQPAVPQTRTPMPQAQPAPGQPAPAQPAPAQPAVPQTRTPMPQAQPAPGQPAPAQPAPAQGQPAPSGRAYVLVVDDDQLIRDMMVNKLEAAGYRVTCAEDAAQSVIQAEGMRLALIISDIEMPGFGSGVEALKKLRVSAYIRKNLPVIFVTGMPPAEARKIVPKTDPYVRLLHKPVDWNLLRQYIKELTGLDKPL